MREAQHQQLSALIDGELGDASLPALLDALERDPELAGRWERYHLISAALHGEPVRSDVRGVAEALATRLAAEPTVLAPAAIRRRASIYAAAPLAGAALAAAVAFLAIFAVPALFEPTTDAAPPTTIAGNTLPPAPQFLLDYPSQRWHIDEPDLETKLDKLLVNHQEYAPASGMKGLLPYATFVGYDAGR